MNIKTYELYPNYDEAIEKLKNEGMSEQKAISALVPLDSNEYEELQGLNRAERRRWLRAKQKRCKNDPHKH